MSTSARNVTDVHSPFLPPLSASLAHTQNSVRYERDLWTSDLFGMPHYIGEESDPVGIPASIGPLLAYSRPITPAAAQARRSSIAPASVPSTSHGGTYGPGTDLRASLGSRSYHSPSVAYSATFAHQAEFAQDHRRPSTSGPLGTEYDYVPPGSRSPNFLLSSAQSRCRN